MTKLPDPVVLVIDQNSNSAECVQLILSSSQYQVYVASEREQAIAVASELEIDLIICDVAVDYDSGIEIIAGIRQLPGRSDVPVMFTSNSQLPDVIRKKHQFGDAFHLRKPFEAKVLLELVEHAMWMPALVQTHLQTHAEHEEVSAPHFLPDNANIIPMSTHFN